MGERNEILLKNDGIYLYSHWDSEESLRVLLKDALIRGRGRWNDTSYLNRIIFSEMIKNSVLDETGYGLHSNEASGTICFVVDIEKQEVNGSSFEDFVSDKVTPKEVTIKFRNPNIDSEQLRECIKDNMGVEILEIE